VRRRKACSKRRPVQRSVQARVCDLVLKSGNAEQERPRGRFMLCPDNTKLLGLLLPQSLHLDQPQIPIATRTACARTAVRFARRGLLCHGAAAVLGTGAPEPSFSCRGAHGAHGSDERDEQEADEECKEDGKELRPQARAVQAGHHLSRLSCQGDGGGAGRHRRRGPRVQQGDRFEQRGDLPAAAARALGALGEFLLDVGAEFSLL
jgi:hypothetical protein